MDGRGGEGGLGYGVMMGFRRSDIGIRNGIRGLKIANMMTLIRHCLPLKQPLACNSHVIPNKVAGSGVNEGEAMHALSGMGAHAMSNVKFGE